MTIIERVSINSPWLFRTQPLQTDLSLTGREVSLEQTANTNTNQSSKAQKLSETIPVRSRVAIDPKKVVKSSTAPNLPTSNSLSEMFHVI